MQRCAGPSMPVAARLEALAKHAAESNFPQSDQDWQHSVGLDRLLATATSIFTPL